MKKKRSIVKNFLYYEVLYIFAVCFDYTLIEFIKMKLFHILTAVIFVAHSSISCSANFHQEMDVFALTAKNVSKLNGIEKLLKFVENTLFFEKSAYNQNRARDESRQSTSKATGPRVQTNEGLVIGETTENSHAFYGVPYGAPPNGTKR